MLYEFLKDNYKEAEPIFFSDIVIKGNRAFSAKSVVGNAISFIQKQRPVILTPFLQDSGNKKCLPGTFIDSKVPNRHCCLTISCS